MKTQRLGCVSPLALISACVTLLILGISWILNGSSMFSPGSLNAQSGGNLGGVTSHAEIGQNCAACHPAPWSSETKSDRCQTCHTSIHAEIADPATLHGALLGKERKVSCKKCHPEHRGPTASLTEFDPQFFEHDVVGYSLAGHKKREDGLPFMCADCHPTSTTSFISQTCTDCHRQIDATSTNDHTSLVGDDCLACHDGLDRYGQFVHDQTPFALSGLHQQASCSECHRSPRSVSDFVQTPAECYACHEKDDAHLGKFGTDCVQCHRAEGWTPAKFDHNLSTFKLEGRHAVVPCKECHTQEYQGTATDCVSCHEKDDEHQGAFGKQCEACHNPSGWEDASFDHSLSAFPLDGAHARVTCEDCHQNNIFIGMPTECAACHSDPVFHLGLFVGQACSACHTTSAWRPASYEGPHSFPMDHGERGNTCADCHQLNLAQWTCYTCHDQGEISQKHKEEGIANFNDCLRCHPTGREEEGGGDDGREDE